MPEFSKIHYTLKIVSAICKLCKGDEGPLATWVQRCALAKNASEFQNVGNYPLLDRTLGHKLLKNARGSKFSLDFQALQEKCQKVGKQPSGRALLWFILNKYSLDKDRGASLSQHHLLSLKLHGKDVKALEEFRQRMLYIMGSLEQSEMPQESALRSMLYEQPLMALAIDKFRCAKEGSSKRTAQWLMEKIDETIELVQQDENTAFVEKDLQTTGGKKGEAPANPAKPDRSSKDKPAKDKPSKVDKPDKPDKPSKEERPKTPRKEKDSSKEDVNAAAAKGKGKDKDDKNKKDSKKDTEKMKTATIAAQGVRIVRTCTILQTSTMDLSLEALRKGFKFTCRSRHSDRSDLFGIRGKTIRRNCCQ